MCVEIEENRNKNAFQQDAYRPLIDHAGEMYLPGVFLPQGVYFCGVYLPGGVPTWGVYLPRGCTCWAGEHVGAVPARGCTCPGRVPCGLSHHAFDVTCMLPPHQLRPTNSAAAYILLVGHVTCKVCWDTTPSPLNRILDIHF